MTPSTFGMQPLKWSHNKNKDSTTKRDTRAKMNLLLKGPCCHPAPWPLCPQGAQGRRRPHAATTAFLPRLFLSPPSWKNACGFHSSNEHDLRVFVQDRCPCGGECWELGTHRPRGWLLAAIAEMALLWGGHKAQPQQPRRG